MLVIMLAGSKGAGQGPVVAGSVGFQGGAGGGEVGASSGRQAVLQQGMQQLAAAAGKYQGARVVGGRWCSGAGALGRVSSARGKGAAGH